MTSSPGLVLESERLLIALVLAWASARWFSGSSGALPTISNANAAKPIFFKTPLPAAAAFTVNVGSNQRGVNSVAISGSTVTLTLASAVTSSDQVSVSYTVPTDTAAARLKDLADNPAASFAGRPSRPRLRQRGAVREPRSSLKCSRRLRAFGLSASFEIEARVSRAGPRVCLSPAAACASHFLRACPVRRLRHVRPNDVLDSRGRRWNMAPTAPGVLSASLTNLSERLVDMLSKASSTAHVLAWPVSTQSMSVKRISLARPIAAL